MLYIDIPSIGVLRSLAAKRSDACISIYLPTTPLTQDIGASRIAFSNLGKAALGQLDVIDFDRRRRAALVEQLDDLADDDAFWRLQANSLAVLVTPDSLQTFRLPNHLLAQSEVSDRFHLKPLLRTVTFQNEALILALGENAVRIIEVPAEGPAFSVKIGMLPKSATDATHRSSVNDRSPSRRIHGSEGQNVLLRQYARQVDDAVRVGLANRPAPLILAATEPLASIYRSINTHPRLVAQGIPGSPDQRSDTELADAARPILDGLHAAELARFREQFSNRLSDGRATKDIEVAARAATFGMISRLLVDMDTIVMGRIDEETGTVSYSDGPTAGNYGITDEIACRALLTGAEIFSVRQSDIPDSAAIAAILRYPMT